MGPYFNSLGFQCLPKPLGPCDVATEARPRRGTVRSPGIPQELVRAKAWRLVVTGRLLAARALVLEPVPPLVRACAFHEGDSHPQLSPRRREHGASRQCSAW